MQNQSASSLNGGMQATWYHSQHAEHSTIVAPSSGSRQVQKTGNTSVRLVLVVGFHARCLYGNMDKYFFSMQRTRWDRIRNLVKVTVTGSMPVLIFRKHTVGTQNELLRINSCPSSKTNTGNCNGQQVSSGHALGRYSFRITELLITLSAFSAQVKDFPTSATEN